MLVGDGCEGGRRGRRGLGVEEGRGEGEEEEDCGW